MSDPDVRRRRRLEPSLVVSVLALVLAMSGTAYAVGKGEITTRNLAKGAVTTAKLHDDAVTGRKVADHSLRMSDIGGRETKGTATVSSTMSVPADQCRGASLTLYNPAPNGVVGSLVVGYLTDANGDAVLDNRGVVVPTVVSETSQGGAIPNLEVCAIGSAQTVPAGSVFHWRLLGP